MNWQAARAALAVGKKVRYTSWWWGRYIYMENKKLFHEDGRPVGPDNGFAGGKLNWEIYDDTKHGAHLEQRVSTSGSDVP